MPACRRECVHIGEEAPHFIREGQTIPPSLTSNGAVTALRRGKGQLNREYPAIHKSTNGQRRRRSRWGRKNTTPQKTVEKNKRSCPLLCARWLLACTMCSKKWKKIVLRQVLRSFEWILSAEEVLGTKITYLSSILKLHYFLNFNALCSCCMALAT